MPRSCQTRLCGFAALLWGLSLKQMFSRGGILSGAHLSIEVRILTPEFDKCIEPPTHRNSCAWPGALGFLFF